jgi:hypothetical protein
MSARSTQVFLHNETEFILTRIEEDIPHGEWGDDGRQEPAMQIAPNTVDEMGSDSSGVATGTEASVRYRIAGGKNSSVYVHWDNPFDGVNSSHQFTDPDFEVFHTGGDGNNAVIDVFLRRSARHAVANFLPSRNGYHFGNHWGDVPYSLPPLRGSILDKKYGSAKDGLCGGMVYSVRDFFEAQRPIPPDTVPPAGEQNPLFINIVNRLFDTFDIDDVTLYLKLMDPLYPDTDENILNPVGLANGRAFVMANIEFPMIRQDILAGHTSPMGLVQIKSISPFDLGHNHQVLAYAYQARGQDIDLWVYDPNCPGRDDIKLSFNITSTADPIVVTHNVDDNSHPIYCFFRTNYSFSSPPDLWMPRIAGVSLIHPRSDEGAVSLYVVGTDGQVWSNFWPAAGSIQWNGWFPIGPNTFPLGSPVSLIHPRSDEGAVSLYLVGTDGQVWSNFWPAASSAQWNGWFPIGPNTFPLGSSVSVNHSRSDEGAVSLYVIGIDGQVWSNFWPAVGSTQWNGWFPIGPNIFPVGSPVSVIHPRSDEGTVSLYVVGTDGQVWSNFWPAVGSTQWNGWFPIGPNTFPVGSPVSVIHPRSDEGTVSLYVVGTDGQVWSNFWPAVGSTQWNGWFPIGPNTFPVGSLVSVIHPRSDEGAVSLYVVGTDSQVWSNFWPAAGSTQWNGWFPIGPNTFPQGFPVNVIHPRIVEGAVSLYVIGTDGKVWSNFWPAQPAQWNGWFPIGDNVFPR